MTQTEMDVRAFAAEFDTFNTRRMIALCEAGRITWQQAADLARDSLAAGLAATR